MKWEVVELMGYAHYASKGYRVLTPLVLNHGYDFVAERDGVFIRVNVKLAGLKSKLRGNSWCIAQASGARNKDLTSNKKTCDVYLAYLPHLGRFIELDGGFFIGYNSKSRIIPKEAYQPQ